MTAAPCGVCERPVADDLRLCDLCTRALVAALGEVPELLAEVDTARSGLARFAGERIGGRSAEVPLPIADVTRRGECGVRLLGDRESDALGNALAGWVRDIAETHGAAAPSGSAATAARWLAARPHELRAHPAADELYEDVLGGVAALRRAIDRPVDRRYLGRCPTLLDNGAACSANLWAEVGGAWARCGSCRTQHDVRQLEAIAAEAVRDRLCTMPELLRACSAVGAPVAKNTGYRWARDGRLVARGWLYRTPDGDRIIQRQEDGGVPVYRVGDALELAQERRSA